ncbi:MAG: hypothetical protein B7Z78_00025 [Rhodospirillales bacterium 20-60-12]|nr:MAG: hypothetical protein B7Z78_00025 [Rhodospirillales bacterium 20-60-12]HQT68177.1 c-type cytochrome [Acetobacteraceae bacterium]
MSSKAGRDPLLLNKVLGFALAAGLVVWVGTHFHDYIGPQEPHKMSHMITLASEQAASAVPEISSLIATADVSKGQAFVQQQCSACHSLTPGGANGIGPNLYGVMGAPRFQKAGYNFSSAVKAHSNGTWDYEDMGAWLYDPKAYAAGTRMGYPGIKSTQTRADVVAYLRTLAATPIALPAAGAGAAPGVPSIAKLYATADISAGQAFVQQQCQACHSLNKGGAAGVGPNLYGVVGAKMFATPGYNYSSAVQAKATGNWTPHELNAWLYAPTTYAPGTRMGYPGIKPNQMRANVIAYLNSLSDSPAKLPGQ